jgi:hypothetical protein
MAQELDTDVLRKLDGSRVASHWRPARAVPILDDRLGTTIGDYSKVGTVPAFSARAVEEIGDLLIPFGELLPLVVNDERYFAFNATCIADALDEGESDVKRFASGGIMMVTRYGFRSDVVAELTVFKIPQLLRAYTFVTDRFVARVTQTDLSGFGFDKVWTQVAT